MENEKTTQAGEQQLFTSDTYDYNKEVDKTAAGYKSGNAVTAMVFGILSIPLCILNLWVPFVHLVGLGFGITAVAMSAWQVKFKSSQAIAALVTGIIGIVLGITCIILGIVGAAILN